MKRSEQILNDNEKTLSSWKNIVCEDFSWNAIELIEILKRQALKAKSKKQLSDLVKKIEKLGLPL